MSPNSTVDQKPTDTGTMEQNDVISSTQKTMLDQNTDELENDQDLIVKQKHKSSMTITGKNASSKQPEISFSNKNNGYSFVKDNKFIQTKDAPKIRNSYLEDHDQAVIAFGSKSSKERTENFSGAYQMATAPTA